MFKQGLFWKNLPESKKRKSDNLDFLKRLGAVSFIKYPCFIFTGTGNINFPEFSKKDIKRLGGSIKVFLYEPQSFYINNHLNRGYYSEFKSDVDTNKIRSLELDSIENFSKKSGLKITVFLCEYNFDSLKNNYPSLDLKTFDLFIRSYRVTGKYKERKIQKKFWCGNWRYTLHRHLIMSWLSTKSGNYSWNYFLNNQEIITSNVFDFSKLDNIDIRYKKNLLTGIENLNQKKFSIDLDFKSLISVEDEKILYSPEYDNNVRSDIFYKSFSECFCLVSNETRFFQPFANISEKTLYSFDQKMPLILVAPPYSLEYVKTMGFKTFDRWWDESYDQETDHEKRLVKILNLIDYIDNMNTEQLEKIHHEMKEILDHNYSVLQLLYKNQPNTDS
jgi:hypothetical protein